ncbi:MAG: methionyl-tRNA formyltransferase [Pelagibacteraceae bacterium]
MSKKIIFMGTPQFSTRTLKTLFSSKYEVVCVYTQPPKKSSRGQRVRKSPIHELAESLNLKVKTPQNLKSENEVNFFKSLNPFLVVVVAYGNIIPKNYLDIPEKGFINIHASLLPKWRGAAPIQRSIMNNEKESGISMMKIREQLDEGAYFKQLKVKIDQQTTSKSLSDTLSKLGAENIIECLELIENNKANFIEQDHSNATYAKKIDKSESKIKWHDTAQNIISKINGLNPSPGAWFTYDGYRYKIWKASISKLKGKPGEILDEKFIVACENGSINILEIQKEGKNKLSIEKFLTGFEIKKGDILE